MDRQRTNRIRKALRGAKLDALVLRLPENIVMSLGVWPMNGFSYAVVTADSGPAALVAPSCEDREMDGCWTADVRFFVWPRLGMPDPLAAIRKELRGIAREHGIEKGRIGYEANFECVAPAHNAGEVMAPCEQSVAWLKACLPRAKWRDATAVINALRATKTDAEVERMRIANRIAAFGHRAFYKACRPGVSEAQLASVVYGECMARGVALPGVRHVNVYPQVSSGPNGYRAWRPVVSTGRRRIRAGEVALLELAVCADGFWCDTTRVKAAGKPGVEQRRMFAAVKEAQAAAVQAIRSGISASRPDEITSGILAAAGFDKGIVHLTGHGLGFRYHEPEPFLVRGNGLRLRAGHTCTVEPGLYSRRWGGIRLEDNVVVTARGCDVLTTSPKVL